MITTTTTDDDDDNHDNDVNLCSFRTTPRQGPLQQRSHTWREKSTSQVVAQHILQVWTFLTTYGYWIFVQTDERPEIIGWLLNTAQSVWYVFREIMRRAYYPHQSNGPLRQYKTDSLFAPYDTNSTLLTLVFEHLPKPRQDKTTPTVYRTQHAPCGMRLEG